MEVEESSQYVLRRDRGAMMEKKSLTYREAGVDVNEGARAVQLMRNISKNAQSQCAL